MAAEEIAGIVAVDANPKMIKADLKATVPERGSTLMDNYGVGPAGGPGPGRRRRGGPVR